MRDVRSERIGTALRGLSEDLVTERRRVALLERENQALKEEVDALRRRLVEQETAANPTPTVRTTS